MFCAFLNLFNVFGELIAPYPMSEKEASVLCLFESFQCLWRGITTQYPMTEKEFEAMQCFVPF